MIGKTISHYKILAKLGEGGMGVVYKAEDTKLKRIVALKFLPPAMTRDEDAKQRFMHEARAASALQHNNVSTIHEINETEDGQMYICMDYYAGEALNAKIKRGPIQIGEAVNIAMQIAQGLDKAHKKSIVHRDIKPGNVVLSEDGVVKIVDFGLAKLAGQSKITKEESTLGTTAYMSPEQTEGKEADHRSDIWSLGVILYELITGKRPFTGQYDQAVIYAIRNEDPAPVTGLRTGVPMELERIIQKAMNKNPEERYQSTGDVLVDLKAVSKSAVSVKTGERIDAGKHPWSKYFFPAVLFVALLGLFFLARRFLWNQTAETINSIAVLPLENLSNDPAQTYFVDGITDVLISE
jgi:serine/threonine protein kinase